MTAIKLVFIIGTMNLLIGCSGYDELNKALANPEHVTKLEIRNRTLDSLPPEIRYLTNLKTLYLFRTRLKHIPKEIGELKNLERLVLSSNKLKSLPAEIGKLTKLKYLSVKNNDLVSLPSSIGNLKSLNSLYF